MAAAAAVCCSGRAAAVFVPAHKGAARVRRDLRASHVIRCSLEEEFKKQLLGRSNGASSSQPERLKDLSASASQRLGGGDASTSSSSGAAAPSSSRPQQPAADAAPPSSNSSSSSSSSSNVEEQPGGAPYAAPGPLPLGAEPYHPLEFTPTSHIDLDWSSLAGGDEPWTGGAAGERGRCFVILFGVGCAMTEGIYSLRAASKEDGLPVDTIVAFENEDDALRYSTLLEATMDHEPTVWPIEWCELLEFCNSAGYRCRLEPAGSLLIPPDYNVGMTDWEKSLRLRKGQFSVLGMEPSGGPPGQGLFVDGPAWALDMAPVLPQDEEEIRREMFSAVIDSQLSSPTTLEAMKASLERLLPREE